MVDVRTNLAGLPLATPLMNASGCRCTTLDELLQFVWTPGMGAAVTKSMTLLAREGNAKPRYGETVHGTINANGLCNLGLDMYMHHYEKTLSVFSEALPTFFSLSAMDVRAFEHMLTKLAKTQQDVPPLFEVNVSCPNLVGGGNGALDLVHLSRVLGLLHHYPQFRFGLKLPPLFSMALTRRAADIINLYAHVVKFVTCSNSLPKGLLIGPETDKPMLAPNGGFGGVGGVYMKPVTLAEVHRFRQCLDKGIQIVGCGGVVCGRDVYDLLVAGADVVQVGSTLMHEGPTCFTRLELELRGIMQAKNILRLAQIPKLTAP